MKTILFIDLDETVMQNPLVPAVFPHIFDQFRRYKPELTNDQLLREMIEILEIRYADKRVDAFDWDELVYMVALKHNVPVEVNVEALIAEYAHPPFIRLYDHVQETLTKLRKNKKRILAVTTNGHWKYQSPTVKALGLRDYFDYILAPDMVMCIKGEKRFYQHTLDGTDIQIAIGDRYDADVEWPKDLGFFSIWTPVQVPPEINPSDSPMERAKSVVIPPPFKQRPDAVALRFDEVYTAVKEIEKWASKNK